jgi:autotransporter-associated beta strand protein
MAAFNVGGTGEFTASDLDTIKDLGTPTGGFRNDSRIGLDTTNSAGVFVYNGAIANTNAGANSIGLTKLGTGTLQLGGTSSYSGGTLISAGTLRAMSNDALGAAAGSVTITNNATFQAGANINAGAARAFAIGSGGGRIDTNGSDVVIGGALTGSTALSKDGAGKLEFSNVGPNSYSGTATVNAGTLAVNTDLSSASVDIQSGATLSGGGSVGSVTVQSGGSVAPGNSPGILTTGDFDLKSGSHLKLELGDTYAGGPDGHDQIHATPTLVGVTLAGDLQITLFSGWTGTIGSTFNIILNSSMLPTIGAFSNPLTTEGWIAAEDAGILFSVDYAANVDGGNNDVTLTLMAIPEPSGFSMLLGSLGLALGLQRFRRRRV